MSEIQPSNTDAILGGQNRLITGTVVLDGIEGIEQLLTSQDEEIQTSALRAALKYENKGLEHSCEHAIDIQMKRLRPNITINKVYVQPYINK
jgi:hypothetical protein